MSAGETAGSAIFEKDALLPWTIWNEASHEKESKMSRRYLTAVSSLLFLELLVVALSLTPAEAQPCQPHRAMWVYRDLDVVQNETNRADLFTFARSYGIEELFLSVILRCPSDSPPCSIEGATYRNALRAFLREAHDPEAGYIRVYALSGNPTLALERYHDLATGRAEAILNFNRAGAEAERFDGVHLDVEPHELDGREPYPDDYVRDREGTIRQYLDMNRKVVDVIESEPPDSRIDYGVDVVWFWTPFVNESGAVDWRDDLKMDYGGIADRYPTWHLMNIVKRVNIMGYYGAAGPKIRRAEFAMQYASELGACASIGVQTAPPSPDRPPQTTFWGRTKQEMEEALADVQAQPSPWFGTAFESLPSFSGFTFFRYSSYRLMPD